MAFFAKLDKLYAHGDHPQRVLGSVYDCAKFGWNRCRSFDNMEVLIVCVWLEITYSGPKIGF